MKSAVKGAQVLVLHVLLASPASGLQMNMSIDCDLDALCSGSLLSREVLPDFWPASVSSTADSKAPCRLNC